MGQVQTAQKDLELFSRLPQGSCVILTNGPFCADVHAIKAGDNHIILQSSKGVIVEEDIGTYLGPGRKASIDRFATQKRQEVCENSRKAAECETLDEYYHQCLEVAQGLVGRKLKNRRDFPLICYGLTEAEKSDDIFRLAGF
jgi:hypothetical protein